MTASQKKNTGNLILILGDQISFDLASLKEARKTKDHLLMAEVREEATYVKHHKKKIAFLFAAMRHHANALKEENYSLDYTRLDDKENSGSLTGEIKRALKRKHDEGVEIEKVIITSPGEYRLKQQLIQLGKEIEPELELLEDDRFFCHLDDFYEWEKSRKAPRMEDFYREMRKRHNILMAGDGPVGREWNFDSENRKSPEKGLRPPAPFKVKPDEITKEVLTLVEEQFSDHFGDLTPFHYAVTRDDALKALSHFITHRLENFGDYQDAMLENEPWMFHSHLSFYINCGLLSPREAIDQALKAYEQEKAPLNAVEGFVRQILGWREYVRGVYWLKMPDYKSENHFNASRPLPEFFWTGKTQMNCLKQCISETAANAYAHHIQRLMVIGNFALLAGLDPDEVNDWYLLVYADAYEWVELPNVTGMCLYADGGYLATKPYAASGAYINRMSNYCKACNYKVTSKSGEEACPFNYLYWDFLERNQSSLNGNHRLNMVYSNLEKQGSSRREEIKTDASIFFQKLENNEYI